MGAKQLATKIDEDIKEALDRYCEKHGLKIGHFVEDAILDKLEDYEDLSDLRKLRGNAFKDFDVVIKELKNNGKI
jgi:predicted DNA-binding protein